MRVLVVGAGVIGTVYGAHLAAAGDAVSVLARGARGASIGREGLRARDVLSGVETRAPAALVDGRGGAAYDLVLVAVRRDQLDRAGDILRGLAGRPALLFFGNNPMGSAGLPKGLPGSAHLGFPGIGGTINESVAEYALIPQQPTALETSPEPRLGHVQRALRARGFAVQRVDDMSGWLAYHAVFVSSIAAALHVCGNDPRRLADDTRELRLMCDAITDGFRALRRTGAGGLARNLRVLHSRPLVALAVRYWSHSMRSPMGELAFAAHSRRAQDEMRTLAQEVLAELLGDRAQASLRGLLSAIE